MFVWLPRLTKERHRICDFHHRYEYTPAHGGLSRERAGLGVLHVVTARACTRGGGLRRARPWLRRRKPLIREPASAGLTARARSFSRRAGGMPDPRVDHPSASAARRSEWPSGCACRTRPPSGAPPQLPPPRPPPQMEGTTIWCAPILRRHQAGCPRAGVPSSADNISSLSAKPGSRLSMVFQQTGRRTATNRPRQRWHRPGYRAAECGVALHCWPASGDHFVALAVACATAGAWCAIGATRSVALRPTFSRASR